MYWPITENLKFYLRCSGALAIAGVLRSLSYEFHSLLRL
jgi:hypothetical protein